MGKASACAKVCDISLAPACLICLKDAGFTAWAGEMLTCTPQVPLVTPPA
jgi:hypothetical protein